MLRGEVTHMDAFKIRAYVASFVSATLLAGCTASSMPANTLGSSLQRTTGASKTFKYTGKD
ncbi:MAG TPA: hypothetical protein VHT92_08625 [Candidatus Cybelea sp.]|nr:hypothetical protein [Candidatus Cybelea sp.]